MKHITNLLGLAMRANCVISGEERVVQSMRSGQAKLVFVANDAGKNTKKKLFDKAKTFHVPIVHAIDRKTLGHSIGKGERVVVAVTEQGFATKLLQLSRRQFGGVACDEKNESL